MKITFDSEAQASYIYFTSVWPGGAIETAVCMPLHIGLYSNLQIATIRLFEDDEYQFQNRLRHTLCYEEVKFDPTTSSILISFSEEVENIELVDWTANIDLDADGQILGIEILLAGFEHKAVGGSEKLYAEDKFNQLLKSIVPFKFLR